MPASVLHPKPPKCSNLITPPGPLSHLTSCTVPGLPLCYCTNKLSNRMAFFYLEQQGRPLHKAYYSVKTALYIPNIDLFLLSSILLNVSIHNFSVTHFTASAIAKKTDLCIFKPYRSFVSASLAAPFIAFTTPGPLVNLRAA